MSMKMPPSEFQVERVSSVLPIAYAWLMRMVSVCARARALLDAQWRERNEERLLRGAWRDAASVDLWFHAASFGEIGGLYPLVEAIRKEMPDIRIHISTTSLTGRDEAGNLSPSNQATLLPLDTPMLMRRALRSLKPQVLVVVETEIWPSLFAVCRDAGIPIVVINGRISDRSFPRYLRFRSMFATSLAVVKQFFVQSSVDAERFQALGAASSSVITCGSTKYDRGGRAAEERIAALRQELRLQRSDLCFVAGSVRPGELGLILDAYEDIRHVFPDTLLIIAPRHPEKFDEMKSQIRDRHIDFHARSDGPSPEGMRVLVLDTLGELGAMYGVATAAFVGASLIPIGGHNPLEPAAYGVPVITGPYMQNYADAMGQLRARDAALTIQTASELAATLKKLFADSAYRGKIGLACRDVWEQNIGATPTIAAALVDAMGNTSDRESSVEVR